MWTKGFLNFGVLLGQNLTLTLDEDGRLKEAVFTLYPESRVCGAPRVLSCGCSAVPPPTKGLTPRIVSHQGESTASLGKWVFLLNCGEAGC